MHTIKADNSPCRVGAYDESYARASGWPQLGRVSLQQSFLYSDMNAIFHRGGGDPFLSGELAFETITGIQSVGVQACAKHYINKWVLRITYTSLV